MDYTNSCIYHIRNKISKKVIYVGSTRDLLTRRIAKHKYCCTNINAKHKYNLQLYNFIRETSFDSYEFIPVKYLSLNNNLELRTEEQNEMDKYSNLLNDQDAVVDMEKRKEIYKEKYQQNKEQLKEYRIINREKTKERGKKYREKNREILKEKNKEKITCVCGCIVRKDALARHMRTKKHLDNIEKV